MDLEFYHADWLYTGDKSQALLERPILNDYQHYIELFTLLRNRYPKTEHIPISEIVTAAPAFGLPVKRAVIVVCGCDSAWVERVNRK